MYYHKIAKYSETVSIVFEYLSVLIVYFRLKECYKIFEMLSFAVENPILRIFIHKYEFSFVDLIDVPYLLAHNRIPSHKMLLICMVQNRKYLSFVVNAPHFRYLIQLNNFLTVVIYYKNLHFFYFQLILISIFVESELLETVF